VLTYHIAQGADINPSLNDGRTLLDVANTEEKKAILRAGGQQWDAPAGPRWTFLFRLYYQPPFLWGVQ